MSRTQAEQLAALLEERPTAAPSPPRELADLATLAGALRAGVQEVKPDPAYRAGLRASLIMQANTQANRPSLLTRFRALTERWRYSARLATASAVAAAAISGGGVAAAAEYAMPGDVLYPVKLVLEDARVLLTPGEAAKGRRQLTYGAERVDEAWAAAEAGEFAGARRALGEAETSIREGADRVVGDALEREDMDAVAAVAQFVRSQHERVSALVAAHPEVGAASGPLLDTLEQINTSLQSALPGTAEPSLPDPQAPGTTPVETSPPPAGDSGQEDPSAPGESLLPEEPLPGDPLPSVPDEPLVPEEPLPSLPEEPLPDAPLPSDPDETLPSTSEPGDVIDDVIDDILTG